MLASAAPIITLTGRPPKSKHANIYTYRQSPFLTILIVSIINENPARKVWHFRVHKDSQEDLDDIMMEHKACDLDLTSVTKSVLRHARIAAKRIFPRSMALVILSVLPPLFQPPGTDARYSLAPRPPGL
jgi:hypothetical protein